MPRNKDPIWKNFICKTKEGNTGKWAICKICEKEMQGIPKRMEIHYELCSTGIEKNTGNYKNYLYLFINYYYSLLILKLGFNIYFVIFRDKNSAFFI